MSTPNKYTPKTNTPILEEARDKSDLAYAQEQVAKGATPDNCAELTYSPSLLTGIEPVPEKKIAVLDLPMVSPSAYQKQPQTSHWNNGIATRAYKGDQRYCQRLDVRLKRGGI